MRSFKTGLILGSVAMLGTAVPALADEVHVDEGHEPRSTVSIVARDGIYGGLAGAAVGGGIMLIRNDGFDGRTLGLASGIGLLAGIGLGFLDAAAQAPATTAANTSDRVSRPEGSSVQANNSGLPTPAFSLQHGGRF